MSNSAIFQYACIGIVFWITKAFRGPYTKHLGAGMLSGNSQQTENCWLYNAHVLYHNKKSIHTMFQISSISNGEFYKGIFTWNTSSAFTDQSQHSSLYFSLHLNIYIGFMFWCVSKYLWSLKMSLYSTVSKFMDHLWIPSPMLSSHKPCLIILSTVL